MTTTTVLFSHANVEAVMIREPKNPRFEITRNGTPIEIIPATTKWRSEQKLAVEKAQALVMPHAPRFDAAIAAMLLPLETAGVKPSRKVVAYTITENPDGSHTVTAKGGKNAADRAAELGQVGSILLSHGLNVSFGAGELTVSEPVPGDDCYEDLADAA